MKNNIKALTAASYLSMLFLGVATSLIGAIAGNLDLTPFQIGLFLTIQNVGFMIAVWVSGALSDSLEKPRILFVGSLILALSFLTFYLTESLLLNLFIMMMIGVGMGSYEGVTDAMLLDMHQVRQSLHININHFFVTFGAILITVYLIFLEMNWRNSLIQSAVIVLILAAVYAVVRLAKKQKSSEDYMQRIRIISRDRLVGALFLTSVLVVGVELGSIGILTTYLMDLRDFNLTTSKIGLVVFLVGIAVGRIVIGFVAQDRKIANFILGLLGLSTITYTLLFYVGLGQLTYLSTFMAGFSLSAIVPLIISFAGQVYPEMAGTVIGSIKVAFPVGGILLPFLMSLLASQTTLQVALVIFPVALFIAFLILFFEFRSLPDRVNQSE
ncbi:MAG TPA: MFS transporter [candidate division Zixibacteria bacterium]|nr:MFS transporter [candidate division Zixibacteria bacterium]